MTTGLLGFLLLSMVIAMASDLLYKRLDALIEILKKILIEVKK